MSETNRSEQYELETGDIIRVKTIKDIAPRPSAEQRGITELTFRAPKGKVFKLILLGVEPEFVNADGSDSLSPVEVLNKLGFVEEHL